MRVTSAVPHACADGGQQALLPAQHRRAFPLGGLWSTSAKSSASTGALSRAPSHDAAAGRPQLPMSRARPLRCVDYFLLPHPWPEALLLWFSHEPCTPVVVIA